MAGFYSARGWIIPPLLWPSFAPPLSLRLDAGPIRHLADSHNRFYSIYEFTA